MPKKNRLLEGGRITDPNLVIRILRDFDLNLGNSLKRIQTHSNELCRHRSVTDEIYEQILHELENIDDPTKT